jgi:hypothetical protein
MKSLLLLFLVSALLLFSCNSDNEQKALAEKESYQLTKQNLLKKEQKNPERFLSVKGSSRKNIIGQTVVTGTISNAATVAVFKDVLVQFSFYSKTGALLETDKETIFETLEPRESKKFKTKYFAPKGTDSVALQILSAKAIPLHLTE